MSDPETKEKRSKRFLKDESHIKNRLRTVKSLHLDTKRYEREPHRLCDNIHLSCGNSNCVMCGNPRKMWKEKTMQERSFEQNKLWDSYKDEAEV